LGIAWQALERMRKQHHMVLIESIGGLGTPITDELVVADLARDWRLATVLVVPVRLGSIAAAVANVALAKQYAVKLLGIVLNCTTSISDAEIADLAPAALIQSLTSTPVLGCIPYLSDLHALDRLATAAANLDLEILLPSPVGSGK
jgi:dethiobiotin synthetase